jgi:glycosyltransferase involved in cell wall biosynthesis
MKDQTELNRPIVVMGWGQGKGGLTTALFEFVKFLTSSNYRTTVIEICREKTPLEEKVDRHLKISSDPGGTKSLGLLEAVIKLQRPKPGLFISIGLHNSANSIAALLPKGTFKILQDVTFREDFSDARLRRAMHIFDAIAPQTKEMENIFLENPLPKGIGIRALPCLSEEIDASFIAEKQHSSPIRLAYFGRLARNKGLEIIISAAARIAENSPVLIDIWGTGEVVYEQELANQVSQHMMIDLKGKYPDAPSYFHLMSRYDGVLFGSTQSEGLPLAIIEALGCGLPILSTDFGAIGGSLSDCVDSVLSKPGIDSYSESLLLFITKIANGSFSRKRQRNYYEKKYSRSVTQMIWMYCIRDPFTFFSKGGTGE